MYGSTITALEQLDREEATHTPAYDRYNNLQLARPKVAISLLDLVLE